MCVLVLPKTRVAWLVEHREVHLREVHQLDVELRVLPRLRDEPVGDDRTHPPWTGAGNDDLEMEHRSSRRGWRQEKRPASRASSVPRVLLEQVLAA